jgi:hypothetical protein
MEEFGEDPVNQLRVEPSLGQEPCHTIMESAIGPWPSAQSLSGQRGLRQVARARGIIGPCLQRRQDLGDEFLIQALGQQLLTDCTPGVSTVSQMGRPELGTRPVIKQPFLYTLRDDSIDERLGKSLPLKVCLELSRGAGSEASVSSRQGQRTAGGLLASRPPG